MTTGPAKRQAKREQRAVDKAHLSEVARIEFIDSITNAYTIDSAELLRQASDETDFIVENAVPVGAIMFIAGAPGSKKSWLAYDLSLAVMRGRPWMCCEVIKPGPVLLLNFDNPTQELGRRYKRMGLRKSDPLRVHSLGAHKRVEGLPTLLRLPDALEAVEGIIEKMEPRLVIFDSFRQAHTMNELSPECMGQLMSMFRGLTAFGTTVVILHHVPKASGTAEYKLTLRGTGELEGSADVIAYIHDGQVEWGKTRGWPVGESLCDFEVVDKQNTTHINLIHKFKPLESLLQRQGPMKKDAIKEELGLNRARNQTLLNQAERLGLITVHAGGSRLVEWKEQKK